MADLVMDQGATFYREVIFYKDASKRELYDCTDPNTIPVCTMMSSTGNPILTMNTSWLDRTASKAVIIVNRRVTANVLANQQYLYDIDLVNDNDDTAYRADSGTITVKAGQATARG